MDPKRKIEVIVTLDIATSKTVEEFVDLLAQPLVTSRPISFEVMEETFGLSKLKYYIREKSMPETKLGSDIIEVPAKLEIGC